MSGFGKRWTTVGGLACMASAMVQVNVRIPPELHERVTAEAGKTQTTVTAVVTQALTQFFATKGKGSK